jgi:hypothetical protein
LVPLIPETLLKLLPHRRPSGVASGQREDSRLAPLDCVIVRRNQFALRFFPEVVEDILKKGSRAEHLDDIQLFSRM